MRILGFLEVLMVDRDSNMFVLKSEGSSFSDIHSLG